MAESDGGDRKNTENRSVRRPILWYNFMQHNLSPRLDNLQLTREIEIWYNTQYSDR